MEHKKYVLGNFEFYDQKDAQLAAVEQKKIAYLKEKMDFDKPEVVWSIYEKAISERIFKTPVGDSFLYDIREYLLARPQIDPETISPIPVYSAFSEEPKAPRRVPDKKPVKTRQEKNTAFTISIVMNIALVIAIFAMFWIALDASQPNILNYEKALLNQYAGWEQELSKREQAVRERERELAIPVQETVGEYR